MHRSNHRRPAGGRRFVKPGVAVIGALTVGLIGGALVPSSAEAAVTHPVPTPSAPYTAMWSWGNSVSPKLDARGDGYSNMTPTAVATFAAGRHLSQVNVSVPWAADSGGPITTWVSQSVQQLHGKGIAAAALGGDPGWVSDPSLASQWITSGYNAAPFDSVELDVEPWANDATWTTDPTAIASYVSMVQAASATARADGMQMGLDVPWWFATTPYNGGTVLDAVIPYLDQAAVVAFSDHAADVNGQSGIISLAQPAATALDTAGVYFTIGVETDTPTVAGGAQYTFYNDGQAVMDVETGKVVTAMSTLTHFTGITVEHYRAWVKLKP